MRVVPRLIAGLVLLVSATAGGLVLTAGPAAASCAEPSADFLDHSAVAFSGVVADRRESGDDVITTIKVDRVFKGEITRRVDVVSRAENVDYSVAAGVDTRVIVFGDLVDGEVTSNLCSTVVGPGKAYREIVAELGDGTAPAAGYMKAERRTLGLTYEQFSAGRAILGALGLIALGYFVLRAWRARRRTS